MKKVITTYTTKQCIKMQGYYMPKQPKNPGSIYEEIFYLKVF